MLRSAIILASVCPSIWTLREEESQRGDPEKAQSSGEGYSVSEHTPYAEHGHTSDWTGSEHPTVPDAYITLPDHAPAHTAAQAPQVQQPCWGHGCTHRAQRAQQVQQPCAGHGCAHWVQPAVQQVQHPCSGHGCAHRFQPAVQQVQHACSGHGCAHRFQPAVQHVQHACSGHGCAHRFQPAVQHGHHDHHILHHVHVDLPRAAGQVQHACSGHGCAHRVQPAVPQGSGQCDCPNCVFMSDGAASYCEYKHCERCKSFDLLGQCLICGRYPGTNQETKCDFPNSRCAKFDEMGLGRCIDCRYKHCKRCAVMDSESRCLVCEDSVEIVKPVVPKPPKQDSVEIVKPVVPKPPKQEQRPPSGPKYEIKVNESDVKEPETPRPIPTRKMTLSRSVARPAAQSPQMKLQLKHPVKPVSPDERIVVTETPDEKRRRFYHNIETTTGTRESAPPATRHEKASRSVNSDQSGVETQAASGKGRPVIVVERTEHYRNRGTGLDNVNDWVSSTGGTDYTHHEQHGSHQGYGLDGRHWPASTGGSPPFHSSLYGLNEQYGGSSAGGSRFSYSRYGRTDRDETSSGSQRQHPLYTYYKESIDGEAEHSSDDGGRND